MEKVVVVFLMISVLVSCKLKKETLFNVEKKEINYIPYYLTMYKADSLYLVNDFHGSYRLLDSLFKVYPPLNSDNYVEYGIYLNSAVMTGHLENIAEKVKFGYLRFGGISTFHKKYSEMRDGINKAANLNEQEISELKLKYYNSLNLDLRREMLEMYNKDQTVRIENKSHKEMNFIDESNRVKLNEIFKKHGFPKKDMIGSNNAYDVPDDGTIHLNIFIMHQPDSVRAKYLPVFLNAVKKGFCEPQVYATIYDRDLILKGENQLYGTYKSADGATYPLKNPKKIDSLRKSIGLPHIRYSGWKVSQFEK
jgi:hypothetical protein